jgi:MFS family permease
MALSRSRGDLPARNATYSALKSSWALLAGIGLLMLGNGLQASLLGLRAAQEGFGSALTGVVMAGFFIGFLVGSSWTPSAVRRVGHVRVFAALASLASISILVHGVFVDPFIWGALRFVTGVCIAGIFVVSESWLNDRATNETRGQMLSFYFLTSFAGQGGGQLLLNIADPGRTDLFILVSVLISLAVVPILLSASPAPTPAGPRTVALRRLYSVSPLGVVGSFAAGGTSGTILGMGAVYAREIGFTVGEISLFMSAVIFGGAILQWPIGKVSDAVDRRTVVTVATFAACALAVVAVQAASGSLAWFLALVGLFGGLSLSLYSLTLANTNDYLEPTEMVGASGGLVLIFGAGSILGPLIAGLTIGSMGPSGFFWWLAFVHALVGVFALWRMTRREGMPREEKGPYIATPVATSSVALAAAEEVYANQLAGPEKRNSDGTDTTEPAS